MAAGTDVRLLIVEDDEVLADALAQRVAARLPDATFSIAYSLRDGVDAIEAGVFDAAVIDLRLPSEAGAGDATIENGMAVEAELASSQPGVLRLFVTASEAEVVVDQLRLGKVGDFFASGEEFSVVDYVRKDGIAALDRCTDRLVVHSERLDALDRMALEGADDLPTDARRALAITVRATGGAGGRVLRRIGLSGAVTALVECQNSAGQSVGNAFCKWGDPEAISKELAGYRLAEFQLPSTAFPTLARELRVGTGKAQAIVFTKAPSGTSFFDLAASSPDEAAEYVDKLPHVLQAWRDQAQLRQVALRTLIAGVLSDEVATKHADELSSIGLSDLLEVELELLEYCQHGDLHGSNLFVATGNEPFLIDFALTSPQHGPVDHVSLELGLLFHPESPFLGRLTPRQCAAWLTPEAEEFEGMGPILRACRRWATADGHDPQAHAVATLAYALWILNHTNHVDQAIVIARAASEIVRG